ncbi:MAG: hypothetical protein AAB890_02020 [Patescibacteria group bacterium]
MKNIFTLILTPIIIALFIIALVYYFFTKNDIVLETVNDIFEPLWA